MQKRFRISVRWLSLNEVKGENDRIVDKHLLDFVFVGLIFLMFPHARIVHTIRNLLDTCLSCFLQNFTKGQDYSFDLRALGQFYNDCGRLMSHSKSLSPPRLLLTVIRRVGVRFSDILFGSVFEVMLGFAAVSR